MEVIEGLKAEDFNYPQVFDYEGYHLDTKIEFKDNKDGTYCIKITDVCRSDKTVK